MNHDDSARSVSEWFKKRSASQQQSTFAGSQSVGLTNTKKNKLVQFKVGCAFVNLI